MQNKYADRLYTTAELSHLGNKLNGITSENDELKTLKGLIKKYPHICSLYVDQYWEAVEREVDNR